MISPICSIRCSNAGRAGGAISPICETCGSISGRSMAAAADVRAMPPRAPATVRRSFAAESLIPLPNASNVALPDAVISDSGPLLGVGKSEESADAAGDGLDFIDDVILG